MSVIREKETIQVSFSKEKLEALKFYMDEKDTTIEKELQGHIKSVYEKYVPAATRRYLDRNDADETVQSEVSVSSQASAIEDVPVITTGTRGRRKSSRTQTEDSVEQVQVEEAVEGGDSIEQTEDENQGMTMNM